MMIFPSNMKPRALVQNKGRPFDFTCDICGTTESGYVVRTEDREPWAVLPDGWAEIEDRRENAKKQFPVVCTSGSCIHEAEKHSG